MLKFGHLDSKFLKVNGKFEISFEISTFKIGYMQNFVKIRKLILFGPKCQNLGIWARNLKDENYYKIPDFPIFEILGRFGSFCNFFGSFRLVSGRFRSFRVLVSTEEPLYFSLSKSNTRLIEKPVEVYKEYGSKSIFARIYLQ